MDDLIKRSESIAKIKEYANIHAFNSFYKGMLKACEILAQMPSAEEEEFEWCHDCKEYDQDAHCCHRFSKRIRQTVEEIKANRPQGEWIDTGKDPDHSHPLTAIWYRCSECGDGTNTKTNYCPNCGCRMKGADDETDKD